MSPVNVYVDIRKCGGLEKALRIFHKLVDRNDVIQDYTKHTHFRTTSEKLIFKKRVRQNRKRKGRH